MAAGSGTTRIRHTPGNKIRPPTGLARLVDRPRLIDALTAGLTAPGQTFMLVSAPAGYGKTALVSQWAARATADRVTTAWCTLDADDRDPCVFWESALAAATRAAEGTAEESALRELESSMEPRLHSDFLAGFTRSLERLGDRVALVFDDTHVLEGSPSEDEFVRLLRLVPPNVYVVVVTRSTLLDQRTRLTNRLRELTADSLSFTRAETDELFDDARLDGDRMESLFASTEGWPAALSLARLSVERTEPTPLDERLGPLDPRVLYDYLQQEVYGDLCPTDQATVLAAAVCPLITADLADAVCGTHDSAASLRRLARSNPMLHRVSTDRVGRTWYRTLPLFAAFLREKAAELPDDSLQAMVERAVEWHSEHGDPLIAVGLALDAEDSDLVDRVIRRTGYRLVGDGYATDLLALVASSSGSSVGGPFSNLVLAWASSVTGDLGRADDAVARARPAGLSVDDLFEWDWLLYLVQVHIALARGERIDGLSSGWADDTLLGLPDPLRIAVHLARGLAETRVGVFARAREELDASRAIAENLGDHRAQAMSAVGLAVTALASSDLRGSLRHAETAIAAARRSPSQNTTEALAIAHILAGWSDYQLLDVTAANEHATDAARLTAGQPTDQFSLEARHTLIGVTFDSLPDKRRAAQEYATNWPPHYVLNAPTSVVVSSLQLGIRMSLTLGEHRWSERLLDRARHLIGEGHDWNVAYAQLLYATGRTAAARGILTPLVHDGHTPRTAVSDVIGWSLEAVLEHESGNPYRAHSAMCRALERADDTGFLAEIERPGAATVRAILAAGLHRFGSDDEAAFAIVARGRGASTQFPSGHLTTRERELLAELRTLRTIGEISADMLLSINTVKTHMRGIYRKLGVNSRRSAVAEAERLGLM
ncbi:LuxR family maltose regulon positive regulatory protein [Conyzicola lurida]|uniref:LuxR family maltose regulon positive regulatory protein n=1 Tax=Conyzicola lurida TaxID=1172621 RepID=A0A841APJ4_9MICO|nr:LuxR C-terminal-related transcriptional regulator [Conyzicola lurida]MBB5843475.1 LuxR family maltose regulon positive regulatory protein [Conyzicola lurida]